MKSQPIIRVFILCAFLLVFFSCKKEEADAPITITLESASEIKETSFIVNWSANSADISQLTIQFAFNESFSPIEKEFEITNINENSLEVNELEGATQYKYRLKALLNNGGIIYSKISSVTTSYKIEPVTFTTSDGILIAGKLKYLESNNDIKPAIIFMHELGVWVNNWQNADVVTSLIAQGYICLIIDFRGHGQSGDYPLPTDASEIEAFINSTSQDLIASINFLKTKDVVDANQFALVGGSLGAIMAVAGNEFDGVKATVALSASRLGIFSIFPELNINSALFIAGELDVNIQSVNFATEANALYNMAEEPKKLVILPGNSAHGTNLLLAPGVNQEIISWINARFENN